jgi:hypothetical protein
VGLSVGHPVVEMIGVGLVVPPAAQRPILGADGFSEVAGAGLDLHTNEQATVEPSGVAGLHKQVGPEVMLRVQDHRSPADPLEGGRHLADTDPACLLLPRGPHHDS